MEEITFTPHLQSTPTSTAASYNTPEIEEEYYDADDYHDDEDGAQCLCSKCNVLDCPKNKNKTIGGIKNAKLDL